MVASKKVENAQDLRARCRLNDLQPSWYVHSEDGLSKKCWLSVDEMRLVLSRFDAIESGRQQWSGSRLAPPKVLHMFWAPPSGKLSAKCEIPSYGKLGMSSALKCGYDVHLWTFSNLVGVPSGVLLRKASDLVPLEDASKWVQKGGLRVQHLSDIVRLRAVRQHALEANAGSWMADMDVIWLRPLEITPSASGHVFASMHARVDKMAWKTDEEASRYWKLHWLRKYDEKIWLGCPWAFPVGSPVLEGALAKLDEVIESGNFNLSYRFLIALVQDLIHAFGLGVDVVDPDIFHAIPAFSGGWIFRGGELGEVRGVLVTQLPEVMIQSVAIAQSWMSTETVGARGQLMCASAESTVISRDSLYWWVARHLEIMPPGNGETLDLWLASGVTDLPKASAPSPRSPVRASAPSPRNPVRASAPPPRRPPRASVSSSSNAIVVPDSAERPTKRLRSKSRTRSSGRVLAVYRPPCLPCRILAVDTGRAALALVEMLEWDDVLALASVHRGATPPRVHAWIAHGFATEVSIRGRLPMVRQLSNLQTALGIASSAVHLWRGIIAWCVWRAFGRVANDLDALALSAEPALCADVVLYQGTFLTPFSVGKVGHALVAHALARSPLAPPHEFHVLACAMASLGGVRQY